MDHIQKIKFLILVVLLCLGLAASYDLTGRRGQTMIQTASSMHSSEPQRIASATPGQPVAGFPKSLILSSDSKIDQSYDLVYPGHYSQYTSTYTTSQSISAVYQAYLAYLKDQYAVIYKKIDSSTKIAAVYAKGVDSDISLQVIPDPNQKNKTKVVVNYLTKQ